jgi:hypothetical protein
VSRIGDRLSNSRLGVAALVLVIAAIGVLIWVTVRPSQNTPDVPNGLAFICNQCKNHFTKTMKELSDWQMEHRGEKVPCPKCKSQDVISAWRCPKCGEFYPKTAGAGQAKCPKCGAPPE